MKSRSLYRGEPSPRQNTKKKIKGGPSPKVVIPGSSVKRNSVCGSAQKVLFDLASQSLLQDCVTITPGIFKFLTVVTVAGAGQYLDHFRDGRTTRCT
jgi:hypothetical protein